MLLLFCIDQSFLCEITFRVSSGCRLFLSCYDVVLFSSAAGCEADDVVWRWRLLNTWTWMRSTSLMIQWSVWCKDKRTPADCCWVTVWGWQETVSIALAWSTGWLAELITFLITASLSASSLLTDAVDIISWNEWFFIFCSLVSLSSSVFTGSSVVFW